MQRILTDLRGVGPEISDIDGERVGVWLSLSGSLNPDMYRLR